MGSVMCETVVRDSCRGKASHETGSVFDGYFQHFEVDCTTEYSNCVTVVWIIYDCTRLLCRLEHM